MIESYADCLEAFFADHERDDRDFAEETYKCSVLALRAALARMPPTLSFGGNRHGWEGSKLKRMVYHETLAEVRESYSFGPLAWLFHPIAWALIIEVVKLVVAWLWNRDDLDVQAIQAEGRYD